VPATPALTRELVRDRTDDLLDVFSPEGARETSRIARLAVSELEWLEHQLHATSSFVIVPLFALANAGVLISVDSLGDAASSRVTLGVIVGLVLGKIVGITGASWLAVRSGTADLPAGVTWSHLVGAAALGAIGFTVSLFITGLAFDDELLIADAKLGILGASLLASVVGATLLRRASAERRHSASGDDA
jgi:NhaA family Na+:H+ antiporter